MKSVIAGDEKHLQRKLLRCVGVLPAAWATFWFLGLGAISITKAWNLMESGLWRALMSVVMLNAAVTVGVAIAPSQRLFVALLLAFMFTGVSAHSVRGGVLTFIIGMAYTLPALMMAGIWNWKARRNENAPIGGQLPPGG